jgi:hypothetical protein
LGLPEIPPILYGDLDGRFYRARAVACEECSVHSRKDAKPASQFFGYGVAGTKEGRVVERRGLAPDRLDDARMTVTVHDRPNRAHRIENPIAERVFEHAAVPPHERFRA